MAEATKISWADSTLNPWIGCTKVGPGCDGCYAEAMNARFKGGNWGPGAPRRRTTEQNWNKPRRWERNHETWFAEHGRPQTVFCASLADVFDNEVDPTWRDDLWALIRECPHLIWLLVTKRIGNAEKMLPIDWGDGYPNVCILATVVNQEEADRDVPKLLATPARWRGLSMEPLLGPVDLTCFGSGWYFQNFLSGRRWHEPDDERPGYSDTTTSLDWIIVGGESEQRGHEPRPMLPRFATSLQQQCLAAGVPFHFKQVGSNHTGWLTQITGKGDDPFEWPECLRVQEFPDWSAPHG